MDAKIVRAASRGELAILKSLINANVYLPNTEIYNLAFKEAIMSNHLDCARFLRFGTSRFGRVDLLNLLIEKNLFEQIATMKSSLTNDFNEVVHIVLIRMIDSNNRNYIRFMLTVKIVDLKQILKTIIHKIPREKIFIEFLNLRENYKTADLDNYLSSQIFLDCITHNRAGLFLIVKNTFKISPEKTKTIIQEIKNGLENKKNPLNERFRDFYEQKPPVPLFIVKRENPVFATFNSPFDLKEILPPGWLNQLRQKV